MAPLFDFQPGGAVMIEVNERNVDEKTKLFSVRNALNVIKMPQYRSMVVAANDSEARSGRYRSNASSTVSDGGAGWYSPWTSSLASLSARSVAIFLFDVRSALRRC